MRLGLFPRVSRALVLAVLAIGATAALTLAEAPAAALPTDGDHWTAYGFNVSAPVSMWPMLELLHKQHFDWELASASQRPTPLTWASMPSGVYGQYTPALNIV